jgi:hypothetical protein
MPLITADRVRAAANAPGTGAVTLASVTGFETFATAMVVGDTCYYTIADQTGANWEIGLGTYSGVNTLTRTTIFESSNANSIVNFSSGVQDVFITYPAERAVHQARSMVYQMIFNL